MSKSNQESQLSDETCLVVPVQSFTTKAMRVMPGTVLTRLGRPDRKPRTSGQGNKVNDNNTQAGSDAPLEKN